MPSILPPLLQVMAPYPYAHLRLQSLATAGCGHEAPSQREEHLTPGMELSPLISKQLLGDPLEKNCAPAWQIDNDKVIQNQQGTAGCERSVWSNVN